MDCPICDEPLILGPFDVGVRMMLCPCGHYYETQAVLPSQTGGAVRDNLFHCMNAIRLELFHGRRYRPPKGKRPARPWGYGLPMRMPKSIAHRPS